MASDWARAHPRDAVTDDYSAAVLAEASVTLTLLRTPMRLGDRLAELHTMVSLRAEIEQRLPEVVAAARDQGHDWSDIAAQLGVTPGAARRQNRIYTTTINTR